MKKYVMLVALCVLANAAWAQLINAEQGEKKQSELDWYNCSFDKDSVYGAEVNKAYEFLKDKKVKKKPVVALIGTGIDVLHEDLKESIWVNPKEKKDNGKDSDKDGLVGDVNGWNFLGGKDGSIMETTMYEGDREYFLLKDKYADYLRSGKNFSKIINGVRTQVDPPANMEEYKYYEREVFPESQIGQAYGAIQMSHLILSTAHKCDKMMRDSFPGIELTQKEFGICYDPNAPQDTLNDAAFMFLAVSFGVMQTNSWDVVYDSYKDGQQIKISERQLEENMAKFGTDHRKEIVGDDYLDFSDDKYGNNVLLTPDASVGTMKAGIIAAQRDNGIGINGIADAAEIMTLRVQGSAGDPYLKDMALAIRYAVDHKADVIVLPEQHTLYPPAQRKWMEEALRYAEENGVLVIVSAWELSLDLSQVISYPNRWMAGEKELTNLMVVSPSDKHGNPSMNSNYGAKEIDLYAPGVDIYTTYTGDAYQMGSGTAFAAVTTAGVAALLKAYYPELTGSQIRDILIENVTSRKGAEVEKGIRVNGQQTQDLFLFDDLCVAGGILNAYQAVVAADKLAK